MTKQGWRAALCAALMIVAAGCGQVKPGTEAGSFAEASKGAAEPTSKPAAGEQPAAGSTGQAVPGQAATAGTGGAVSAGPEKKAEAPEAGKPSDVSTAPANQAPAGGAAEQPPAAQTASTQGSGSTAPQGTPPAAAAAPPAGSEAPPATAAVKAPETAAPQSGQTPPPAVKAEAPAAGQGAKAESGPPKIKWQDFFDDDKQNRPAEKFWDLSEQHKTVQINGYMGEVLSFDKHWFLLIPQPGAECPFDNGDETYWNKIMMVFVPDDVKLRYTSGPLKITGRLDVGIKVDESGYKTMFRLYDAKFEPIKE